MTEDHVDLPYQDLKRTPEQYFCDLIGGLRAVMGIDKQALSEKGIAIDYEQACRSLVTRWGECDFESKTEPVNV